ncbi:MAG: hypothetical protein ACYTDV_20820 [Planctomycetota bacterium]|jgi:hypothetical protein
MNYALSKEEFDNPESRDIHNQAFWDKLGEILSATLDMAREKAKEIGIDLDAIDTAEIARKTDRIHETAKEQPHTRAAMKYAKMVDNWFETNRWLLEEKGDELESLAQADIPGTNPDDGAVKIHDCIEVVRWYQHQIYVKLCRAASGTIRDESEYLECTQKDADGSAKVAIIGIERSAAAWAALVFHFPDLERSILQVLVTLKHLLKQVDESFPNARSFLRPGFDKTDDFDP